MIFEKYQFIPIHTYLKLIKNKKPIKVYEPWLENKYFEFIN